MKHIQDFELFEKKKARPKKEIVREEDNELDKRLKKDRELLDKIKKNEDEDPINIKMLKQQIKEIDIQTVELEFKINELKEKKIDLKDRLKIAEKNDKMLKKFQREREKQIKKD